MSPRRADPSVRAALLDAAAEIIATQGSGSLTLRGVAGAVGTSTMAVYTHFGSMPELRRAVRVEGFAHLRAALSRLRTSDDPIADLWVLAFVYRDSARARPAMYRVMFMEQPLDERDATVGRDTFFTLVAAVRRAHEAACLAADDSVAAATQLWALSHGSVSGEFAGIIDEERARQALVDGMHRLLVSYGADPQAARAAAEKGRRRSRRAQDARASGLPPTARR